MQNPETMHISDKQLQDYLDGDSGDALAAIEEHLHGCGSCCQRLAQEQGFRSLLRQVPVPPASPGFAARALRQARKEPHGRRHSFAAGFSGAMAAGLLLLLAARLLFVPPSQQLPGVTLALAEVQEVNLVFTAPRDFDTATLEMELPPHLELVGFPGERLISWQTSLHQGQNLLSLPLVAYQPTRAEVVTRIAYDGSQQTFRLQVDATTRTTRHTI